MYTKNGNVWEESTGMPDHKTMNTFTGVASRSPFSQAGDRLHFRGSKMSIPQLPGGRASVPFISRELVKAGMQ